MNSINNEKENLQKDNTIRFIKATQELIDEIGIEKVSIRKIAEKSGFHNSTIYLYFKDVDELILFASMRHFHKYSKALGLLSSKDMNPDEVFWFTWRFFIESMLLEPKIYYNFFFGKHGKDFGSIMIRYYNLFPHESEELTPEIENMFFGKDIRERCLMLLRLILDFENNINADNLTLTNDIIVACVKYTLEQKCQNPNLDSDRLANDLMHMIVFTVNGRYSF